MTINRFIWILLFFSGIISCRENSPELLTAGDGTGLLTIGIGLDIENESGRIETVNTDTWNVIVYDVGDNEIFNFADFTEVPSEIELTEGDYYVFVSSEDESVAFDTPFYTGTSDVFTIVKGDVITVSVDAALANVKVSVGYSAAIQTDFTDWTTTITSASGSIVFNKDETRSGFFVAGEELTISADLTFTKADLSTEVRNVTGVISGSAPRDHYLLTVDYTLEDGVVSPLTITVDETTNDIPIEISEEIIFNSTFGGSASDTPTGIRTSNGTYTLAGRTSSIDGDVSTSLGSIDAWVINLSEHGSLNWERSFGTSAIDEFNFIDNTSDGGYIAAGSSNSDVWVVKIDMNGNETWSTTFGGTGNDIGFSASETSDGGYIISSVSSSSDGDFPTNQGSFDIWILKLDNVGTLQWQQSFAGSNIEFPVSVFQSTDDHYYLAIASSSGDGNFTGNKGGDDVNVFKLNNTGGIVWQAVLGGTLGDNVRDMILTSDNGVIISGDTFSSDGDIGTPNRGGKDAWVVKLNSAGIIEWEQTFGGSGDDELEAIVENSNGGFYVVGNSFSSDGDLASNVGDRDAWIINIDATGNLIWSNTFGGSAADRFNAVSLANSGVPIVAGQSNSIDGDLTGIVIGSTDFWVLNLDANGQL